MHVKFCADKQHCPETQLEMVIKGREEGLIQVELEQRLAAMDKKRLP